MPVVLKIVLGRAIVFVFITIAIIVLTAIGLSSSNKLVCESKEGNITIVYTDDEIIGYTANGITYNLEGQKKVARQIDIDSYMKQFNTWFETNTTGTCVRQEK